MRMIMFPQGVEKGEIATGKQRSERAHSFPLRMIPEQASYRNLEATGVVCFRRLMGLRRTAAL